MDFKTNYQVKFLSNHFIYRKKLNFYSSMTTYHFLSRGKLNFYYSMATEQLEIKLNPYFITGFTDGEWCFSITIIKNSKFKFGWRVQAKFFINIHKKDQRILDGIQAYFLGGV
uniref:hypothetical protein n=1 Tax=Drechslerella dactyloides TaxID=74499 RepID=UPI0022FD3EFC|nr:hypothetical protein PNX16_mgp048 [Drechslerella dactyloides]WAN89803.1 hypothetical protein [Drechslerella dactyloides]